MSSLEHKHNAFTSGSYHRTVDTTPWVERKIDAFHLKDSHNRTIKQVERLGWDNPFDKKKPVILLAGTASKETTEVYSRFTHKQNPSSRLHVVDISAYPLEKSKDAMRIKGNPSYIQADLFHLPFQDNSFDLIQTDTLIQFFPNEKRPDLFKEWARIMQPGGVITTRNWILSEEGSDEKEITKNDEIANYLQKRYGTPTYATNENDIKQQLDDAGFDIDITPNKTFPLMKYLLAKKGL